MRVPVSKLFGLTIVFAFAIPVAAQEPITPIEPVKEINLAKVELGKKLFFDPRLSKSGFISCNSCHNLSMGGTDNLKTSIGHNWQQGPINSPTVLNSSMNIAQFWDGRAADLKEQAGGPIANPGEMAFTHTLALEVLEKQLQTAAHVAHDRIVRHLRPGGRRKETDEQQRPHANTSAVIAANQSAP